MNFIRCPECNSPIASGRRECPRCGEKLKSKKNSLSGMLSSAVKTFLEHHMKIIGGNFGLGGSAVIRDGVLLVATDKGTYTFDDSEIKSVSSKVTSEKKFGCIGFVIGSVILGLLFGIFLSILGVLIGVILAAAMSWYRVDSYEAIINVTHDRTVILSCSKNDIKKLTLLSP